MKIQKSGVIMGLTISILENMKLKELYELAQEYKVTYYSKLTKKELIFAILKADSLSADAIASAELASPS